ncbi:hypothetical protein BDV95DRAFT_567866 [Massariosphaeria phaeospora]|uniref:Uncharacterized protein n=1 Tax=Massariosphaeria phaeospora TaxID=100035 RepID=A0A7C8IBE5_9PLEO|nr:hypothetical protein BDV95DRAFT_567866 [Massariosphaeria phaeospora]
MLSKSDAGTKLCGPPPLRMCWVRSTETRRRFWAGSAAGRAGGACSTRRGAGRGMREAFLGRYFLVSMCCVARRGLEAGRGVALDLSSALPPAALNPSCSAAHPRPMTVRSFMKPPQPVTWACPPASGALEKDCARGMGARMFLVAPGLATSKSRIICSSASGVKLFRNESV